MTEGRTAPSITAAAAMEAELGPWTHDGDTLDLREGDVMTFPAGGCGEWTAHSRMRKLYCTFVPGD